MAIETERKYLVEGDSWKKLVSSSYELKQSYEDVGNGVMRVRTARGKGYVTLKFANSGISRYEYEYEIPLADAKEIIEGLFGGAHIEKIRHELSYGGKEWIVDEFKGRNEGLVMAEIELESEDEKTPVPEWAVHEVTGDYRYYNSYLSKNPYSK